MVVRRTKRTRFASTKYMFCEVSNTMAVMPYPKASNWAAVAAPPVLLNPSFRPPPANVVITCVRRLTTRMRRLPWSATYTLLLLSVATLTTYVNKARDANTPSPPVVPPVPVLLPANVYTYCAMRLVAL